MPLIPVNSPAGAQVINQIVLAQMGMPNVLTPLLGMSGDMKKARRQSDGTFRTSVGFPIVTVFNGGLAAGDEIKTHLRSEVYGCPFVGGELFEGKGKDVKYSEHKMRLQLNQFPVNIGNSAQQQKAGELNLTEGALEELVNWVLRYQEELIMVRAAGARGFERNHNWSVPLESDTANWNKLYSLNPVTPPSRIRHFVASGSSVKHPAASGADYDIASTDLATIKTLEAMIAAINEGGIPMAKSNWSEDGMPSGSRGNYVLLVSEGTFNAIKASDSRFVYTAQQNAIVRGKKDHEVFLDEDFFWNGVRVTRLSKPIRFYAGDPINYCASTADLTTTSKLVPAAFAAANLAVDRSILIGATALAYAMGKVTPMGGAYNDAKYRNVYGFHTSFKSLNHDMHLEAAVIANQQISKITSVKDVNGSPLVYDYGCAVLDSVVPLSPTA